MSDNRRHQYIDRAAERHEASLIAEQDQQASTEFDNDGECRK